MQEIISSTRIMNCFAQKYRFILSICPRCVKTGVIAVLMAALPHVLSAQDEKEAELAYEEGNYFKSIELYSALIEQEPDNKTYMVNLGRSYLNTYTDPLSALGYLLAAEDLARKDKELYLDIARAYSYHLEYDRALEYLDKFEAAEGVNKKNESEFQMTRLNYIIANDLLRYPIDMSFENLGPGANSEHPDYHPFVTRDGSTLFFTSRRKVNPGSKREFDGYYPSDTYLVYPGRGAGLETARRMSEAINSPYDEQIVGITATGDSLFLYIDHVSNYGDLSLSLKEGTSYRKPKLLDKTINSPAIESACTISPDGKTMIFSSDRPGGTGNLDLWIVEKTGPREWGQPRILSGEINTTFDEDFPNFSEDGKTLYLTSDGHPGLGGFDVFFSTWDEETGSWTRPQNVGYPINTPFDDKSISFETEEGTAYLTAIRPEGIGDLDVYRVRFYEAASDNEPAVFLINIPALLTGPQTEIRIENEDHELVGTYMPNNITNRYVLALFPGKYYLSVKAEGFQPYSETMVVNEHHLRPEQNIKIINLEK